MPNGRPHPFRGGHGPRPVGDRRDPRVGRRAGPRGGGPRRARVRGRRGPTSSSSTTAAPPTPSRSCRGCAGVTVVRPGRNLGFAAGCNLGARQRDRGVRRLRQRRRRGPPGRARPRWSPASTDDVGLTTASLRLYDEPGDAQLRRQPGALPRASAGPAGSAAAPAYEHGQRGPRTSRPRTGAATVRRADRFARARRVLRADVRLLRGHRPQPALLAARLAGRAASPTRSCCTATSSAATR